MLNGCSFTGYTIKFLVTFYLGFALDVLCHRRAIVAMQ